MPQNIVLMTLVTFLHNFFTAAWIGGMLSQILVVLPSVRKHLKNTEVFRAFNITMQKNLRLLAVISIIGLAITGIMLSRKVSAAGTVPAEYANNLSIKHILMALMVAIAATRTLVLKKVEKRPSSQLQKISMILLVINNVFGITILFISAYLTVLH